MTLTTKEKDLITYYDLGECISEQIYYFVNDKPEFCVSILLDEDKNPNEITDKQIEEHFYNDYYMAEFHFEDFEFQYLLFLPKYFLEFILGRK